MKGDLDSVKKRATYHSRMEIGFLPDYEMWKNSPATFTKKELIINGHPVMETWEKSYMKELASVATLNRGVILEVGFGMGISAQFIQEKDISTHIIIEANQDVFVELLRFTHKAKVPIIPCYGFWQSLSSSFESESIDGILFDTYPLSAEEIHRNHYRFFDEAYRLLKPGGVFTYYSDEVYDFSDEHKHKLKSSGFKYIDKKVCSVSPPKNCNYWKDSTIVVPIIKKMKKNKSTSKPYGLHFMIDGYKADSKKLQDVNLLYQTLLSLPDFIGMTRVGFPHIIQFTEGSIAGISGFIFILESHISVHSYTKKKFISIDIYSCKQFDHKNISTYLKEVFGVKHTEEYIIERGKQFNSP